MKALEELGELRKNTIILYGSTLRYDLHKKAQAAYAKYFHKQDLTIFHDTPEERCQRNAQDMRKMIQLLQSNEIVPEMLEFLMAPNFYPTYVLEHHFSTFIPLVAQLLDLDNTAILQKLYLQCQAYKTIGCLLNQTINVDNFNISKSLISASKSDKYSLSNDGTIMMKDKQYFYSLKSSLLVNVCCVVMRIQGKDCFCIIRLRDQNGEIARGVEVMDMGASFSNDYFCIGYRFNGVKPLSIVYSKSKKIYRNITSIDSVVQFGYSLQDLMKSLHITTRYTSMRRQFKTIDQSSQERQIVAYQAVGSRIIDGFAQLFCFGFFRQRLLNMPILQSFLKPYLPYFHKIILEKVITLRECCGGFGYMQISGHPACIERVIVRSAQPSSTHIPQIAQIMKRTHLYTSDHSLQPKYLQSLSRKSFEKKDILPLFSIVCMNMQKNRANFLPQKYMQQYLTQSIFQTMHSTVAQYSIQLSDNINNARNLSQNLMNYSMVGYIIKNSKYINWSFCQVSQNQYMKIIMENKNTMLKYLTTQIQKLDQLLEIDYIPNTIIGQENSEQFYMKVLQASKNNKRNSQEYRRQVQEPLAKHIQEQRARI